MSLCQIKLRFINNYIVNNENQWKYEKFREILVHAFFWIYYQDKIRNHCPYSCSAYQYDTNFNFKKYWAQRNSKKLPYSIQVFWLFQWSHWTPSNLSSISLILFHYWWHDWRLKQTGKSHLFHITNRKEFLQM